MNSDRDPKVYIIAGPNGAGKTTFATKFLPHYVECMEFVNADLIASALSPFLPDRAAFRAGTMYPKMLVGGDIIRGCQIFPDFISR